MKTHYVRIGFSKDVRIQIVQYTKLNTRNGNDINSSVDITDSVVKSVIVKMFKIFTIEWIKYIRSQFG